MAYGLEGKRKKGRGKREGAGQRRKGKVERRTKTISRVLMLSGVYNWQEMVSITSQNHYISFPKNEYNKVVTHDLVF